MNAMLTKIIGTLAIELLVPLVKELLGYIVNSATKGTGITNEDYEDISDLMSYSSRNNINKT